MKMDFQKDQRLPSERLEQTENEAATASSSSPPEYAPPLPYREPPSELRILANTASYDDSDSQSPEILHLNKSEFTWSSRDPRNASTDSLLPESDSNGKRTLLLIFIHGFMGNETSFQSFPAHLHSLLTELMKETHIVHTKLYPRYKSRKSIEFFSY